MKNNNGNRNRSQDQWRNRDNRNEGNTNYDERNRYGSQYSNDDDWATNRLSGAGNFNNDYGSGGNNDYGRGSGSRSSYGSNWSNNMMGNNDDDYNRNRNDRNQDYRSNDYNRQGQGYGSDYGRGYGTGFGRPSYGNYSNRDNDNRNENDRTWWDKTTDEVSSWFGDDDAERRRRADKMNGPHRGKGPKGYARSDEKIKDDINDKLYHDSYVDAGDIEVTVTDGEVTLTGTVDSKETKRRAEDLAEDVTGVKNVSNNLRVNKTGSSMGTSQSGTFQNETSNSSRDLKESYRSN